MKLNSISIVDGARIDGDYAFGIPHPEARVQLGGNRNPQLDWSDVPPGTKSFAIVCVDPDVPSRGDDVNQPDRTVPASLPRVDFYHWTLVDLPASITAIAAGEYSRGVTPKGKPGPSAPHGARQGINSYTDWFAGDADMAGDYYGYDGPCPPWNDEILHHYVFTVYALDVEQLPLAGRFTGAEAVAALKPHVLAEASLTGTYSLNPQVA